MTVIRVKKNKNYTVMSKFRWANINSTVCLNDKLCFYWVMSCGIAEQTKKNITIHFAKSILSTNKMSTRARRPPHCFCDLS